MSSHETPRPSSSLGAPREPSWREYPVGTRGRFATSAAHVLVPLLIGLAATFGLILTAGIAAEEEVLDSEVLNRSIDQLTRFSLLSLAVVAWLAELTRRVALGVRDVEVSRAVHAAALERVSRLAVPHPRQVEAVTSRPWAAFSRWCLTHVVVLGSCVVLFFLVLVLDPFVVGWWILLGIGALGSLHLLADRLIRSRVVPPHRQRHRDIGSWWTVEDEQAAWDRVRAAGGQKATGAHVRGSRRLTVGNLVLQGGGLLMAASLNLLIVVLVVTHPDAERWSGGQLGQRAELDPTTERLVDLGVLAVVGGVALGVLLGLLGTLVEGSALSQERRLIRAAVEDPDAPRPAPRVLARHAKDHAPHWAQAIAVAAAACLSLGLSGAMLGSLPLGELGDVYAGADAVFSDRRSSFFLLTVAGATLLLVAFLGTLRVHVRHLDLRSALVERWPVEPVSGDDDDKMPLARVGPALSAPPDARSPSTAGTP